MDDFTKNILAEWGFTDYIETFNNEEIGHEQFMTLTESMIGELIPEIGRRSIFLSKFINFKKNQIVNNEVPEDTISNDVGRTNIQNVYTFLPFEMDDGTLVLLESNKIIDESILTSCTSSKTIPVIDPEKYVKYILKKSQNGLKILEFYNKNGALDKASRKSLTDVLVKHELLQTDPNHEIKKPTFLLLIEGIVKIFPEESKDTYYKPHRKIDGITSPAKGKLYKKFKNMKSNKKKIGNNANDDEDTLTDRFNNSSLD